MHQHTTAIIFDLDGTLLNTLADLAAAVNHTLQLYHCPERSIEEIESYIGNGVRHLIACALPADRPDLISDALADFRAYYRAHITDFTLPYPGMVELLQDLKTQGYPMAVVTNKYDAGAKILVEHFFPGLIDVTIGEGGLYPAKPEPDAVFAAMEQLGVTSAVYVGDSPVDAQTTVNSHLPGLLLTWGFAPEEALVGYPNTTLCHNIAELRAALAI